MILQGPGKFVLTQTAPPQEPAPGQALVRVHQVGICGTDLHAFAGQQPFFDYPRILGHELGVEIVAIGENDRELAVGDRCAVAPFLNCGHCVACRRGKTNCCASLQTFGVHVDGGMRELVILPVNKLHRTETLSYEQLPLIETLSIGAHAVARAQLEAGENVLVVGAGPIGLSSIIAAQIEGGSMSVMELSRPRIEFCRRHLGVESFIDPNEDVVAQLEALYGEPPTTIFDATGNAKSMMNAFNYVAASGQLVFVGFSRDDITFHNPDLHRLELTVKGSRNATGEDFARVILRLERGQINVDPWITHRATLDQMIEQFPGWLDPAAGVIKAIVSIE